MSYPGRSCGCTAVQSKKVYRKKSAEAIVIVGWVNYFRIANMKSAIERIDMKLRSRIRVIIWKQWKVTRKQIKSLIQLGIPEEEAKGLTFCRKGYRYIRLSKVVQRALSKQRGLPSALEHYLKVHTVI